MNIFVVLRALRDPAGFTVNRKAQKVFVNRESYLLNPADRNALEAALQLGQAGHAVTALAYGGTAAEAIARQARAVGASRAVWLHGEALAKAEAGALGATLRRAFEQLGQPDLVLLGSEVLDADLAQLGARLAAALDWPYINAALDVSAASGDAVRATVADPAGGFHGLEADLPAVVSVARDSNRPRYAPAAQIITAFSVPDAIETLTLEDLGEADQSPRVTARGESFPPERVLGRQLEGTLDQMAQAVAESLRQS